MKKLEKKGNKPKVAFVVEGETDQAIIETLARRIAADAGAPGLAPVFITLSGSPKVRNMFPELHFLKDKGYRTIVVFDTDGDEALVRAIKARLIEEGLEKDVKLVAVAPSIEAWLATSTKPVLKQPAKYAEAIEKVPLANLRRNKAFGALEKSLKEALHAA